MNYVFPHEWLVVLILIPDLTRLQRKTGTKQYTILLLFITLKMLKSDPEAPAPRQGRRIIRTRSFRATVVLIFFKNLSGTTIYKQMVNLFAAPQKQVAPIKPILEVYSGTRVGDDLTVDPDPASLDELTRFTHRFG